MNQTIISGKLGRNPEKRFTPSGKEVTNFSVAVNKQWTGSDGEKHKETTWFRIAAWGRLAQTCAEYLVKGSGVIVSGELVADPKTGGPRVWQGEAGPGAAFELTAHNVEFTSRANGDGGEDTGEHGEDVDDGDDIPF